MDNLTDNLLTSNCTLTNYTPIETWIQAIFFYFIGGIISVITNTLIILILIKNRQLKSRFFLIISYLAICRLLLSLNIGLMGIQRTLRQLHLVNIFQTRIICNTIHLWMFNGVTLELMLILLLVIDRVIAIVNPSMYKKMNNSQANRACIFCYVLSIAIKTLPTFLWDGQFEMIRCINIFSGVSGLDAKYIRYIDAVLGTSTILIYLNLMIYIRIKVRKQFLSPKTSNAAKIGLNRQLALMPVLRNQIILHSCLFLMGRGMLFVSGIIKSQENRLIAWGGNFLLIDVMTNSIVFLLGNKYIREGGMKLLKGMTRNGKSHDPSRASKKSVNDG